ncbi:phage tail spike protein [Sutcliffiella horikoshii]|uniref:Tail spike domain-containing protein n=1 Tax=Sutcliffiella horikoshii TaxID=79883 RepID=A0A5D4TI95_9BACI|nr:phage tail spike protein [Sutcliffiella horikoshii]TYS74528.1 hypothetical protein FZC75_02185 [Sutcliffiella horikoshii]
MIEIKNRQLQTVAILENAYQVGYEKTFNDIWTAKFTLPLSDPKNEECQPFNFVEIKDGEDYIGLFRIIPKHTKKSETTEEVTYTLWHVITTLMDDVLFRYHQTTNWTTRQNIEYILSQQSTVHWVLGDCEFTRYFHYSYENENGLAGPLFSIPKPFDQEYEWTYDTTVYPFVLNLVEPSNVPECEIREAHNQIGIEKEEPNEIVNRIYPLGYGEGVNQLGIEEVNGGVPYVEDAASIAKYGVISYVWIDRKFQDAVTLKANAEGLLKKWANPSPMYRINAGDVSYFTHEDIHKLKCGRIVRVHDSDLGTFDQRIMRESKSDIKESPFNVDLDVGSLTDDIATLQQDLDRKMQINEAYSQGATNLLSYSYNDNADDENPAEIVFFLPNEMVNINELTLWFETDYFRGYSRGIEGGGGVVKSTSSGGGQTTSAGGQQTTSSGGGQTTSSGGGTNTTSGQANGYEVTIIPYLTDGSIPDGSNHIHGFTIDTADFDHWHTINVPPHTHSVSDHTHSISDHTHTVSDHEHDIELEPHTHPLQHGIFQLDTLPSNVEIRVDGNLVSFSGTSTDGLNLIPHLAKDGYGKVTRGKHVISLTPNERGRINAQVNTQFFIQSRGQYAV